MAALAASVVGGGFIMTHQSIERPMPLPRSRAPARKRIERFNTSVLWSMPAQTANALWQT